MFEICRLLHHPPAEEQPSPTHSIAQFLPLNSMCLRILLHILGVIVTTGKVFIPPGCIHIRTMTWKVGNDL